MKEILKLGLAMIVVTFFAGFVLDYVYRTTKPRIDMIKAAEEEKARIDVMPDADAFRELLLDPDAGATKIIDGVAENLYWAAEKNGDLIGYVIKVYCYGYDASPIVVMLGLRQDAAVEGIKVIAQAETPGLGARCQETEKRDGVPVVWFAEQYKDLSAGTIDVVKKTVGDGENSISAITGATVTSKAITDGINKAALLLFSSFEGGGDR